MATDLSAHEVSGTNNGSRRYSVTAWNAFIAALEAAYDLKPDSSSLSANTGASLVGFIDSGASAVARTVLEKLREAPLSPEDFGAVGDGTTDDYAAFVAMAAAVSANGGGHITFGKGKTYYIGQYETAANGVTPLNFEGCTGLTIDLNGSKIDFKGDFDRDVSTTTGIGVQVTDCRFVRIFNGELDGNVEQTTNSSESDEDNDAVGLNIRSCDDVVIDNLNIHHFATDGLAIRSGGAEASPGVWRASKRVRITNTRMEYNSRLAMAIIGVRGMVVENCSLSYTARHAGTYGTGGTIGHAPKAATSTEATSAASTGDQDVDSGDVLFKRCEFIDNFAGDIRSNPNAYFDGLTVEECRVVSTTASSGNNSVSLTVPNAVLRNNYIDIKANNLSFGPGNRGGTILFEGNEVRGTLNLLSSGNTMDRADFLNNRFISTATSAIVAEEVITIDNANARFENNYIFIPKEGFVDGGAADEDKSASFTNALRVARNRWTTDLPANQGGATAAHYYLTYASTVLVEDDVFDGTAPGTADTFRPGLSSTFDTNQKYSENRPGYAGVPGVKAATDAALTYQHGRDPNHIELAAPLTAARTVTLSSTDAAEGAEVMSVRTAAATGAFAWTVGSKALGVGQWARHRYSGGAWALVAAGDLADVWTSVTLGSDFATTSTTHSTITDGTNSLSYTPAANSYFEVEALLLVQTPTTTDLAVVQASIGAGQAYGAVHMTQTGGSASARVSRDTSFLTGAVNAPFSAGTLPAADTPYMCRVYIRGKAGATPGVIALQLAAETSANVKCLAGSQLRYKNA